MRAFLYITSRGVKLNGRRRTAPPPCAQGQLKLAAEIAAHPDEERLLIQPEGLEQVSGSAEKELLVVFHIDSGWIGGTRQVPGMHTGSAAGEDKAHTLPRPRRIRPGLSGRRPTSPDPPIWSPALTPQ